MVDISGGLCPRRKTVSRRRVGVMWSEVEPDHIPPRARDDSVPDDTQPAMIHLGGHGP